MTWHPCACPIAAFWTAQQVDQVVGRLLHRAPPRTHAQALQEGWRQLLQRSRVPQEGGSRPSPRSFLDTWSHHHSDRRPSGALKKSLKHDHNRKIRGVVLNHPHGSRQTPSRVHPWGWGAWAESWCVTVCSGRRPPGARGAGGAPDRAVTAAWRPVDGQRWRDVRRRPRHLRTSTPHLSGTRRIRCGLRELIIDLLPMWYELTGPRDVLR